MPQRNSGWSVRCMKSCGMQHNLETRLLAEQNHQAAALFKTISGDMREQQRAREKNLRLSHDECHRKFMNSQTRVNTLREKKVSIQPKEDRDKST
eukprot:12349422-Prorocentrum_lima.AAC.1